jgi:pimeloyl-ACP methyl ester carboxylesterase
VTVCAQLPRRGARWLAGRWRAGIAGWGWGARRGEAPVHGAASTLDRFWCPADDVLGVGQQQRCLDLERDLGGIFGTWFAARSYSPGGYIAQQLAVTCPALVRRLVLVAGVGAAPAYALARARAAVDLTPWHSSTTAGSRRGSCGKQPSTWPDASTSN